MAKGSYNTKTPIIIPNCNVWLDATDATTITQSSGLVSSWADKSGRANSAAQGTEAVQPSYLASGINGLPSLSFSLNKLITNGTLPALQSGFTILIVMAQNNIVSGAGCFLFSQGGGNLFLRNDPPAEGNKFSTFINVGGSLEPRVQAPATFVSGTSYIASAKYDTTTLTTTIHNNGSTQSITRTPAATGVTGFAINNKNNSNLLVGELIVFRKSLSDAELIQVTKYLSNKWGIAIS